ncbi:hypothetical protein BELL_0005g00290 [Botrytis elliptica]|uniref:Uncharacterized protein n=1 Tax=Botrytis elliptica TaxID=278938 RepID=A0A4Z1K4U0_9HELO|nr:hypothetical protein BELL_0005g00290 [Botrytis elliptica]
MLFGMYQDLNSNRDSANRHLRSTSRSSVYRNSTMTKVTIRFTQVDDPSPPAILDSQESWDTQRDLPFVHPDDGPAEILWNFVAQLIAEKHECSATSVLIHSIAVTYWVGRLGMAECRFVDAGALGLKLKELGGGASMVEVLHVVYGIAGS